MLFTISAGESIYTRAENYIVLNRTQTTLFSIFENQTGFLDELTLPAVLTAATKSEKSKYHKIMKHIFFITIAFLILSNFNALGQQFEFTLYFEDAKGNKDSVVLGYDNSATYNIDFSFGEKDISTQPYDSVFEARGAAYQYP